MYAVWEKMTLANDNITYNEAIQHYNSLKEKFLESLKGVVGVESQNGIEQLLQSFTEGINQGGQSPWGASSKFISRLEKALLKQMDSMTNDSELLAFAQELSNEAKQLTDSQKAKLSEYIEKYLSVETIERYIRDALKELGTTKRESGFDSADVLSWARGYCRNLVFNTIKGTNHSYKPISTLQGYFREGLVAKAGAELAKKINSKFGSKVMQSSHIGKKNLPEDLLLSFLPKDFSVAASAQETLSFGVQVKSYKIPLEFDKIKTMSKQIIKIASANTLYKSWTTQRDVINQQQYLEKNLRELMGYNNVMWVTNATTHWTGDLISKLKEAGYRAVFKK